MDDEWRRAEATSRPESARRSPRKEPLMGSVIAKLRTGSSAPRNDGLLQTLSRVLRGRRLQPYPAYRVSARPQQCERDPRHRRVDERFEQIDRDRSPGLAFPAAADRKRTRPNSSH